MIRRTAVVFKWRVWTPCSGCIRLASSASPTSLGVNVSAVNTQEKKLHKQNSTSETGMSITKTVVQETSRNPSLVATAFKSLKSKDSPPNVQEMLQSAKTVEDVLSVTVMREFSQYHALQALSILADWTTHKKIEMNEFERDPRFTQLCKALGPGNPSNSENISNFGDLAVVLGVTGEDQAAKLITNIPLTQKIRVLSSLALKKRRSVHLLRALAINMGNSIEKLDIKEAADVFYAMSVLNFPDLLLLNKVASDVCESLPKNTKPAVIGSILTSIGLLKYKNKVLLDALAVWIERNIATCREQELVALLLTLASVNYQPNNAATVYKIVLPCLNTTNLKPNVWLDVVWSLLVLEKVETHHLQSVLVPEFVERLTPTGYISNIPVPMKMKLLNINAAAQLIIKNYKGPLLKDTSSLKISIKRSREKMILIESVLDSLTNLLPTPTYMHTNINTDYGFMIDGECAVDSKCNPLPLEGVSSTTVKRERIVVLVCDYHDVCRECEEIAGPTTLQVRILESLGYKVMIITYLEFNPRDKLVSRVKFLEQKLKKLAASPP